MSDSPEPPIEALTAHPELLDASITVSPGPIDRTVTDGEGRVWRVPEGWSLLAPGDSGLTRRCKAMGPSWTMVTCRGRKTFSQGLWAPAAQIERAREAIDALRSDPKYQKRLEAEKQRRALKQVHFVKDFKTAVEDFLYFHSSYKHVEKALAQAVSDHTTPVGSGTVARSSRVSMEERAEAAVIAWMRHQTTAYDNMEIPNQRGKRREMRRLLAERSRALLDHYRNGAPPSANCPLAAALQLDPSTLRRTTLSDEDEAERLKVEEENKYRVAAGLPPTPWPRPAIGRPRGGW